MTNTEKLIEIFRKFPTVGPRTASRFVFYLMKLPKEKIDELSTALLQLKDNTKFCSFCYNPFENSASSPPVAVCFICQNPTRNRNLLCVVEKETDLISIENTKRYNGLYFILGGTIGAMKKSDLNNLRIAPLLSRLKDPKNKFSEVIIALNPTQEGKATSILLERYLKEIASALNFKITHLAQGLPVGGELEYADEETLKSAFEGRK